MLDKIKRIKYNRLKEEEKFIIEIINVVKPFTSDKYPESVFWKKNDTILFEQDFKNGFLRVNNKYIWSVLVFKYGYNFNDVQPFIKEVVGKYKKFESLTPTLCSVFHINGKYKF